MAKIVKISCKAVILCGSSSGTCTCALQKKEGCEVSLAVCRENRVNERRSRKMGFHTLGRKMFSPTIAVDNLGGGAVGWQLRVQLVQPPVGFQLLDCYGKS